MCRNSAFDCITLDLSLGQHAGVEMLRHLWVIGCKAPIIIISGCDDATCSDTAKVAKSLNLNVWESIPKPVDLAVLRSSLDRLKAEREEAPTLRSPASGGGKINEPSPASGRGKINEPSPASGGG